MCLTIPMRIESIEGLIAHCEALGVRRQGSLLFMQDDPPRVGDYVMVHLGMVMQQVAAEDARQAWDLYSQVLAVEHVPEIPATRPSNTD